MSEDRHTCWPGLAYVVEHGLEGYPAPIAHEPYVKPVYPYQRKTSRREGQNEWGEIA